MASSSQLPLTAFCSVHTLYYFTTLFPPESTSAPAMVHSFWSHLAHAARASASTSRLPPRISRLTLDRVGSSSGRILDSRTRRREFHFDTHHFVRRLEREGLNRAQAEGIMSAMSEIIDESIRNMTSNMVTKADQEKVRSPPLLLPAH